MVMEFCLTDWFKNLQDTLLYQPVEYSWDSERPLLRRVTAFRNFHAQYALWFVPAQFLLNQCNQLFIRELFKIFNCPSVRASGLASMVCLDVTVCQPYIFRQGDNLHEIFKHPALLAAGIQPILDSLKVIIFRMAQFCFSFVPCLLLPIVGLLSYLDLAFLSLTRTLWSLFVNY